MREHLLLQSLHQLNLLMERIPAKLVQVSPNKLQQRQISGENYFNSMVSCDSIVSVTVNA